jgi:hypothetical protein
MRRDAFATGCVAGSLSLVLTGTIRRGTTVLKATVVLYQK